MEANEIKPNNWYALDMEKVKNRELDGLYDAMKGTNGVVKVVSVNMMGRPRRPDGSVQVWVYGAEYTVSTDCLMYWVPAIGEEAEFSDDGEHWFRDKMIAYYGGRDTCEVLSDNPLLTSQHGWCKQARPILSETERHQVELPITEDRVQEIVMEIVNEQMNTRIPRITKEVIFALVEPFIKERKA